MVDLEINEGFQRKWCLLGINETGQAMFCFGAQPHDDTIKYFDQCPTWRQVLPVTILLNHCSLRLPKKPREGHLYAFRLNINSGPMTGKLIIDPGSEGASAQVNLPSFALFVSRSCRLSGPF